MEGNGRGGRKGKGKEVERQRNLAHPKILVWRFL